ncbi:hypothetical protein CEXT_655271 [Caerostris extrusa]|uniref:Uncharacterized protein n=1 Tax=Caerostris extrusa TaxID=172846 RepID=A0AAV4XCK2_CAEEX|nr:hypothetical protein CEXT_655271 [Caerostris extrusa]
MGFYPSGPKVSLFRAANHTSKKGVAKADTLLMSCTLQEWNKRQFQIQFAEQDGVDGTAKRKECTNMLKKFIHVVDYSSEGEGSEPKDYGRQ